MSNPRDDRYAPIDYEFTLPDGSKRIETLVHRQDLRDYFRKHNAVHAEPAIKETTQ